MVVVGVGGGGGRLAFTGGQFQWKFFRYYFYRICWKIAILKSSKLHTRHTGPIS